MVRLLSFIIFAILAIAFITFPTDAAEIKIVLDKLSPQPVEQGQDFVLSVTLANEGDDAKDVSLTIVPDPHIILKNSNDRIVDAGSIIKNGAYAKTYLLHMDPSAASGFYEVEFRAHWLSDDMQRETNKTFDILVRGIPQLVISNITINPEQLSPKDTFDLTFSVSNKGAGIARNIQISTATYDTPFIPVYADTQIIQKLDPGEGIELSYRFQVKDKTEISSYSIPVKMEYKDENGTGISSQSFVGVKVIGKAELSISNIKNEPQNPEKGDIVTVTMRIENSGNGDAKSAKVDLTIPFEGTKTAFLGKIKPNDDAPASFTFLATESGNIPYSATIGFEDDLGLHNTTEALQLFVRGSDNSRMVASVIVGMLIIGAIVFHLLRKKKNR